MELKEIPIDKIKPNPYQARVEFPEEKLKEMANTIRRKEIGLLQPISVRRTRKGDSYELIMGEMRVRASKIAGLKKIPAIIKEVADTVGLSYTHQRRLISHLELNPDEQDRVDKLEIDTNKIERIAAIEDESARSRMIEIAPTLSREEFSKTVTVVKNAPEHLKKEMLAPDSKITPEIATKILDVKDEKDQKAIVTKVKKEEMSANKTEKLVNTIKKSTETVKKAILKPKSRITSEIADTILTLQDERAQEEVTREVEEYRLNEDETKSVVGQIVSYKDKISPPKEEWEKLAEELRRDEAERAAFLETPDAKRRAKIFRNWLAHGKLDAAVGYAMCPICGACPENLVWKCHNLTIADADKMAGDAYQKSMTKGKGKEKMGGKLNKRNNRTMAVSG